MQKRVLIVEDNAVISMELKHDLRKIGYSVVGVSVTGEEALEMVGKAPVDIVVMDIKLAGKLDGVETAEIIMRSHKIPIVYLTAHSDPVTFERVKRTNPHGYLIKPFDINVLNSILEIAVHKSQAEKQLRESEILFRTLVESSHDGIFIMNGQHIVYANEAFAGLFGTDTCLIPGMTLERFFLPEQCEKIYLELQKREEKHLANMDLEMLIRRMKGGSLYINLCLAEIVFEGSECIMGTAKDISHIKQKEIDLINLKEEIEYTDYLKTEFIGLISHEIRTPINIIHGYLTILNEDLEGKTTDLQQMALDKVSQSALKLVDAAEKIIEYSQLTTNAYQIHKTEVVLDDGILETLIFDYTLKAQKKGLYLLVHNEVPGAKVYCDIAMTEKIIANLIDNAVRYTEQGGVQINVLFDNKHRVKLEIADTGPGIDNTYIANLFLQDYKQQKGMLRSYDGNGLGLTMVKRYAEINDIQVLIDSAPGKGTIVKVVFNA